MDEIFNKHFVGKDLIWAVDSTFPAMAKAALVDAYEAGRAAGKAEREAQREIRIKLESDIEKLEAKIVQFEMDATAYECSLNTLRKLLDGPPCLPLDQETPEAALTEWTDCIHRALVFLGPDTAIKAGAA